jgi:peptidoglycan-N-acetylglucosamine deacetylase
VPRHLRPAARRFRRLAAAAGGLLALVLIVAAVQPLWAFALLARASPRILWRAETAQPLVGLTFDDGPSPEHTPRVLERLARHQARATFFLIGERAAAHPGVVATLRAGGHEVGNHTFSIRSTLGATDAEFVDNLLRTERVLQLRGPGKLFRPPGGKIRPAQLALLERHGYRCVLGSAYPYDAKAPAGYIRWLITKNLAPGVIVILHDGIADPSRMFEVLDDILLAGRDKGLRFVPVGELPGASRRP